VGLQAQADALLWLDRLDESIELSEAAFHFDPLRTRSPAFGTETFLTQVNLPVRAFARREACHAPSIGGRRISHCRNHERNLPGRDWVFYPARNVLKGMRSGQRGPMRGLAQLAQLEGRFCNFAHSSPSRINGLVGSKSRFRPVVPTKGIF
jgi:hypothetical protein